MFQSHSTFKRLITDKKFLFYKNIFIYVQNNLILISRGDMNEIYNFSFLCFRYPSSKKFSAPKILTRPQILDFFSSWKFDGIDENQIWACKQKN